ncbi:MAG: hypothetical protein IPL61_06810 [Myxococcales bacterium]|nr:hypothetical protein [Myxococcales bacterium]
MYPPSIVRRSPDDGHVGVARVESDHAAALVSDQERFLASLGVTSVGAFSQACVKGGLTELIRVSEATTRSGCPRSPTGSPAAPARASSRSPGRRPRARPRSSSACGSSSRSTASVRTSCRSTTTTAIARPRRATSTASTTTRRSRALRIDLLTEHLRRLAAGDEVATARYDFRTGKSDPTGGRTLRLGPGEIVLLEGIHGLNPRLHAMLPPAAAFAVFVCPLAQLPFDRLSPVHPSDVRLVRRIVRDRHTRNLDAAANIGRWDSVRRGERRHIFPYQHTADVVFDTSLIYELSVLKIYAQRYLLEVPHDHPSYTTAFRLLRLLDRFVPIYSDHVPPTSILREVHRRRRLSTDQHRRARRSERARAPSPPSSRCSTERSRRSAAPPAPAPRSRWRRSPSSWGSSERGPAPQDHERLVVASRPRAQFSRLGPPPAAALASRRGAPGPTPRAGWHRARTMRGDG